MQQRIKEKRTMKMINEKEGKKGRQKKMRRKEGRKKGK